MRTLRHISLMLLVLAFLAIGCGESLEQRIQRGLDLTEKKNYAEAIKHFDDIIVDEPTSSDAWNGRGMARKASGDLTGSMEDYNRAIDLDPEEARWLNNRGTLRWEQRDLMGALNDLSRALELRPEDDLALYNRAQIRILSGNKSGALEDLQRLSKLVGETHYGDFHYHRGYARSSIGEYELAELDLTTFLETCTQGSLTERMGYMHRGMTRVNMKTYDGAYEDLKRSEDLGLRDKEVFYYQGYALAYLGRWEEALVAMQQVLELDPTFAEAKWATARCLEKLGREEEACSAYREGIALGFSDVEGAVIRVCK